MADPPSGDLVRLLGSVAGEMAVADVPVTAGVDLEALKAGDESPLEVVVSIPSGRSKRGWLYRPEALQQIVRVVGEQGLPGYLGHQRGDAVEHEFPPVATHWIGALFKDDTAFVRGVVDPSATSLKRWLKAKTVRTVSIFGRPQLTRVGGETHVTGYEPLSIDWTPLGRNGMPTSITAMSGEMDAITGGAPPQEGKRQMTLEELLAELRKLKAAPAQVLGEMGWQARDVVPVLNLSLPDFGAQFAGEQWGALQANTAALGEIAQVFGLGQDARAADTVAAAKAAHAAQQGAATQARTALLDKVLGEMVSAEPVRPVVRALVEPKLADGADEAAVRAAVGELTALDHIKALIGGTFRSDAIRPMSPAAAGAAGANGSAGSQSTQVPSGVRVVRRAI